jgi:NAD(P)-dependent dehydrogenase (short-subunit alcohol dehydrogenase family)
VKKLSGGVAVVTGAASGIGRALALEFAAEGMTLALADRDEKGLHETVLLAARVGGTASLHVLDVSDESAVNAFAQDVLREHGRVSIVVNNAGVSIFGTVQELATDEIGWLMNINFWGVVYGTKAFLPALLAQPEACLVNVSSVFGLWGPPGQSAYAASKFAVRGFTEALRGELLGTNVHVLTVHPGGIKTAIARSSRVARAADPALAERSTKAFEERLLTTPPETMAAAIVDGIKKKRDRVVAGAQAPRIDVLMRLFPTRAPRWFSRQARGLRE